MTRQVHIVPHTHWDREWYKPYPVFRMQLVELLDVLLPQLEADEGFAHFQLDGQLAVVDDYLEIRPDQRDRLAALNRSGRLSMGPWYTLPDEFLVSGETHVRNLRLGLRTAEDFGGSMPVGYLPDMFGHVAQMPQILAGFGLRDAVVWRGVPRAIGAPAFRWEAPDGTSVRAEYLPDGYGNGARLPADGQGLIDQLDAFGAAHGRWVGTDVLWMNGTDHLLPQPRITELVAEANELDSDYEFEVTSLAQHLADAPQDGLGSWTGEMRSGARSNLLMGVASCRVDVKQAAATAERWLERVAEPLATCWQPADNHPHAFLDVAWKDMVRNAAHDSICGCSADEVNDAVLHRYAEATRVAEAITERALVRILATSGQDGVVVNPSARARAGMVQTVIEGSTPPPHAQQLSVRPERRRTDTLARRTAVPVVMRALADDPRIRRATFAEQDDGAVIITLHADPSAERSDTDELRRELEQRRDADPEGLVHLEVLRPHATQEVLLRSDAAPGYGWRGLAPADLGTTAVRADGQGLSNGLLTVLPNQSDGTFSLNGLDGLGRLVDDGDSGDTYNWSPPAFDGQIDEPDEVDVAVTEAGPVRGRIEIRRTYRWPLAISKGRRVGSTETTVLTRLELRAGEDLLRVHVSFDNRSKDHRLRMWFPLPNPAATSHAECAFTVVERGLTAEGGANEVGLPTYPSRRFVEAGGLLVGHVGLCEYELVDVDESADGEGRAGAIALTLLRSVGLISAGPMAMRALPAGPPTPTPDAQMLGIRSAELVLHAGGRNPYEVYDEAFSPLLTARFPGRSGLGDPTASFGPLSITGAEVSALTRRDDGRMELRVFNPTDEATTLAVDGRSGQLTDLAGDPTGERFDGRTEVQPHQILTIALDEPPSPV